MGSNIITFGNNYMTGSIRIDWKNAFSAAILFIKGPVEFPTFPHNTDEGLGKGKLSSKFG